MERKDFLAQMGMGAALVFGLGCLGGCSKSSSGSSVAAAPSGVDFTLDLTASANANLKVPGGYVYNSGIVVAYTLAGTYIAVSQACTHEGVTVNYDKTNKQFWCPSHGAKFSESGTVVLGPATSALKQYATALTGTTLRIVG